ncbi:endo-1,4-beta-xylanase [Desertivirga brevis]|uniref:endo-1,4-beta-xylanase n=1 Tax=Desertivirga brevis TaxID=2810310 RepID=UPI001A979784|nr:endo-1,4-beta-xylanase [Pedobacter sp. SYSU D00873]
MKINKITAGIAISIAVSSLLVACSQFETREFSIDKPQSLIDQEALDAYKELKTYVNYNNQPNFKLGVELSVSEVAENSPFYRAMQSHFDEINFTRLNHMDFVPASGAPVMDNFIAALDVNKSAGMAVHAGHLLQHSNQNATYLNSLIPDLIIPGPTGTHLVENFESRTVGSSFPVYYSTADVSGTARISTDPVAGATNSGKTLKLDGPRAFPQYQVNLPSGVTLGDCKKLLLDANAAAGNQGAGISLGISTAFGPVPSGRFNKFNPGRSLEAIGAVTNVWGRNLELDLSTFAFTDAEKQLNSFVLTFGNETGGANMHLDNIRLTWAKFTVIPKTPAERKTIFTAELDKWIKAIGTAGKDKVKSWSVVYQPLDDIDPAKLRTGVGMGMLPANTFYWQDYLGREYAATAIKMLKQYANPTDKIFITETNLVDNVTKIQGLKDYIAYTETQGANVDGIATELALNVTTVDKTKVEAMLQALAATGKLIKISALDIGTGGNTAAATAELYQQQAETYKWFVKAYNTHIPAGQRAGITFRSPYDRISSDSWRPNEPVGLWTRGTSGSTVNAGYQRKPAYVGVVEAFQGK